MTEKKLWGIWSLAACLFATGCARGFAPSPAPETVIWRNELRIEEDLTFGRGSRLVLEPGTVVRFAYRDDDGDGWGDASLRIEGELVARGTPEAPVVFTSDAEPAEPGGWGEIRLDFGSFDLKYAVVEGSTRGIHAHFSSGTIEDAVFRRNVDGTRFGESIVRVEHCLFYGHPGKALNARRCRNRVTRNVFHHNRNGVFLFEADAGSSFEENVFRANDRPFRLGDFFAGIVQTRGNDWGGALPATRREEEGEATGRLDLSPGLVRSAGVRRWPFWREAWTAKMEAYVDAAPVVADEGIYAAAWDGDVARFGTFDGARLGAARLPDVVDAAPALGPGVVAVSCWDRGLYLLKRTTLRVLDVFRGQESPADDHRQSAPVFSGTRVFAATWSGFVRAFETSAKELEEQWSFRAGGPFRAALSLASGTLLAPNQDGSLYALDPDTGRLRWRYDAGAPLLSAPALGPGAAYLADREGRLHAVDVINGKRIWLRDLGGPVWYAPPLIQGDVIYQGDDSGTVRAVEVSTGRILWTRSLGAGVRARPAAVWDASIAVPTLGGRLYLLDANTGLERSCWEAGDALHSSPAEIGSRVFVGSRDGFLRALDVRVLAGGDLAE